MPCSVRLSSKVERRRSRDDSARHHPGDQAALAAERAVPKVPTSAATGLTSRIRIGDEGQALPAEIGHPVRIDAGREDHEQDSDQEAGQRRHELVGLALDVPTPMGERNSHRDRRHEAGVVLDLAGRGDGDQDERQQHRRLE